MTLRDTHKGVIRFLLALLTALSASITAHPGPASADTIVLAADSWCPYNCQTGFDSPGYVIELTREALRPYGHTIVYDEMTWPRAIERVRMGKADALICATREETPDFFYPAEPVGSARNSYYTRVESRWVPQDKGAFSQVRLGLIADYDYGPKLNSWIEANRHTMLIQIVRGNDALETNIRKLLNNRIDVVVEIAPVMRSTLRRLNLSKVIRYAGKDNFTEESDNMYLAFSPVKKQSRQYARQFDEGLRKMRADGRLEKLLKRYGLEDWKD